MSDSQMPDEDPEEWQGDFDPLADPEERRVVFAALDSFRQYRRHAHLNSTHRRRQAFYALPSGHWQMLSEAPFSILDHLNAVDDAIDVNADIADAILAVALDSFRLPANPDKDDPRQNWHDTATAADVNKAHSTIRQFYRDWSAEGQVERDVCYEPVKEFLLNEFAARRDEGEEVRVLVPGAGLGRFVFDLCIAGFHAEGNEISYHQLMASSWVLNHTEGPGKHTLHPFALQFSNLRSRQQQLRSVAIPDNYPATAIKQVLDEVSRDAALHGSDSKVLMGSMTMTAADFVVCYRKSEYRELFGAVATVFFIDTAPNLIRYIETIWHCLEPNGVWINVGPLLWHFEGRRHENHQDRTDEAGIGEPGNVELTHEEVLALVSRMGFVVEEQAEERTCGYIQDEESMLLNKYRPVRWVARKKQ
ncbi:hypothetical protein N7532_006905 [Penicillium argentinense]|uniref:carnosine N-methyltransferase n=1 Tax=Penicillium argentinense TaxID=1131581 RepID=A0A9W9FGV9_9EURO|nr:uncharacterized protein N7532_006905 [Penicillium argentinense]KAJ5099904.1 hypothetical protein N7532_006905 [Penicillium argentinense]